MGPIHIHAEPHQSHGSNAVDYSAEKMFGCGSDALEKQQANPKELTLAQLCHPIPRQDPAGNVEPHSIRPDNRGFISLACDACDIRVMHVTSVCCIANYLPARLQCEAK